MEPTPPLPVRSLLIMHFALLAGQIIFLILAALLVGLNIFPEQLGKYAPELILTAAGIEILAFVIARIYFKRQLKFIYRTEPDTHKKITLYRAANIVRWGILMAAALLTIALFLLTNQWLILIIAGALIFIFFTTRPTAPNIALDLQIPEREVLQLE